LYLNSMICRMISMASNVNYLSIIPCVDSNAR
jgi:hypothetical protein